MRQAGDNTVAIIGSDADKRATGKMGKAQAIRPRIVGEALARIRRDLWRFPMPYFVYSTFKPT
jgi:hypothetical protein